MEFSLWIEIQKTNEKSWGVSYCMHDCHIYKEHFFITGVEVKESKDGDQVTKYQQIPFNKKLAKRIGRLLFPNTEQNYISVTQSKAWDWYHYCLHSGFAFAVHPVSISQDFFRFEIKGSQEEIYNKCLKLNMNWLK